MSFETYGSLDLTGEPGAEHVFERERAKKKANLVNAAYRAELTIAQDKITTAITEDDELEELADQYAALVRAEVAIEQQKQELYKLYAEHACSIVSDNCSEKLVKLHQHAGHKNEIRLFLYQSARVQDIGQRAMRINHYGRKNKQVHDIASKQKA